MLPTSEVNEQGSPAVLFCFARQGAKEVRARVGEALSRRIHPPAGGVGAPYGETNENGSLAGEGYGMGGDLDCAKSKVGPSLTRSFGKAMYVIIETVWSAVPGFDGESKAVVASRMDVHREQEDVTEKTETRRVMYREP